MEHGTNKRFEYNRVSWHFLIFKLGLFLAQDAPLPLLTDTLTTPCCEREAVLPAAVRSSWKAAAVGTQCTSSHLALDVVPRMDTARAGPRAGRVQGLGWHDLPTADLTRQRFSCWANSLVSLRPLGKKKKKHFFSHIQLLFHNFNGLTSPNDKEQFPGGLTHSATKSQIFPFWSKPCVCSGHNAPPQQTAH